MHTARCMPMGIMYSSSHLHSSHTTLNVCVCRFEDEDEHEDNIAMFVQFVHSLPFAPPLHSLRYITAPAAPTHWHTFCTLRPAAHDACVRVEHANAGSCI